MAYVDLLPELKVPIHVMMNQQKKLFTLRQSWRLRLIVLAAFFTFAIISIVLQLSASVTIPPPPILTEPHREYKEIKLDKDSKKRLDAAEEVQMARAASIWEKPKYVHPVVQAMRDKPHVQRDRDGKPIKKLILIHGEYYLKDRPPFLTNYNFDHCKVPHCEWTQDKSRAKDADAVWLHVANFWPRLDIENNPVPARPSPNQVWIAGTTEWDGVSCSEARAGVDGYANWTMSFRRDADIWWPYGYAVRTPTWMQKPNALWDRHIAQLVRRKSKMVYFQSKHCETESRRLEYVEQLREYIDVNGSNAKGECLPKLPDSWWERQRKFLLQKYWPKTYANEILEEREWVHDDELLEMLSKEYRFVIAFENSLCQDYVTEKFWKLGLNADVIPIVRNGKEKDEISQVAPPGSYINAREFRSPAELAAFLQRVVSKPELHESFFQWRKAYTLMRTDGEDIRWNYEMASGDALTGFCQICEKLHAKELQHKIAKFSDTWCWEEKGPEKYATPYSGCVVADDLEPSPTNTQSPSPPSLTIT